ncbi:MAG: hypothetical protein VB055_02105 [Oscillospiraceae bacterium]|nr:hypothetical protein [Oscillospiraceae bacterium]
MDPAAIAASTKKPEKGADAEAGAQEAASADAYFVVRTADVIAAAPLVLLYTFYTDGGEMSSRYFPNFSLFGQSILCISLARLLRRRRRAALPPCAACAVPAADAIAGNDRGSVHNSAAFWADFLSLLRFCIFLLNEI